MLSGTALKDFKKIYKDEFGKELSDAEALELAANLLTFFNHIYRPIKKEWLPKSVNKLISVEIINNDNKRQQ